MNSKYYKIGEIVFELRGEREIADSELFQPFKTDLQKADEVIEIISEGPLEIKGRLTDSYSNKEIYENNGKKYLYSFYPQFENRKIYFACSENGDSATVLTVDYEKELYDSMLFNSIDFPGILIRNNSFLFHCSFILADGKAILFSGDSGKGKSTQADLWRRHRNAEIINGDRAILKMKDGKLYACGTPYCGSSKISVNKSAEVAAIIFLEHAKANSTEKISASFDAVPALLSQLTFSNSEDTVKALMFSEEIFNAVPLFKFPCVPDVTAVETLENELKRLGIL